MFSWGLDNCGQLGLGTTSRDKRYAHPVFCSFNILIKDISCGEDHSGFISESGHVYCMGSNSAGKLGTGLKQQLYSSSPCLVEELANNPCAKISCGWTHTAVVTEEGSLFTWGSGEHGALGSGRFEDQWLPARVASYITDISCGARHMGAVSNNSLYMCGFGEMGQLGTGRRQTEVRLTQIQIENVKQVSCGVFHSGVVTQSGEVYMMGGNSFGQLGTGNNKSIATPRKICVKDAIRLVCANSTACIAADGLYVWGASVFGENLLPSKVKVSNFPIVEVAMGGCFCVVVDSKCNVYSWGMNTNGELALGDFEARNSFVNVPTLRGKNIRKVGTGGNFAICLGVNNREKKEVKCTTARGERETDIWSSVPATARDFRPDINKNLTPNRIQKTNPRYLESTALDLKLQKRAEPAFEGFDSGNKKEIGNRIAIKDQQEGKVPEIKQNFHAEVVNNHPGFYSHENQINTLRNENFKMKEEIFRIQKELESNKQNSKSILEETTTKIKEAYQCEIQGLKMHIDQQLSLQNALESDLTTAVAHTTRLEEALTHAHKELSSKAFLSQSDLLMKLEILEDEKSQLEQLIENSKAQFRDLQVALEKTHKENMLYRERNQDLQQEQTKLHDYIQDLQSSVDDLHKFINQKESDLNAVMRENQELQSQVLDLHEKNQEIFTNFETGVSRKAQKFRDKTIHILSGHKSVPHHSVTPDRSFDESDANPTGRKELSNRQQIKIKNAVNRILEHQDTESPLKNLRISSPSRKSPERPSPYKSINKEFSGVTPSKDDVRTKITALMQNRSRIEKKLRLLQSEQENY